MHLLPQDYNGICNLVFFLLCCDKTISQGHLAYLTIFSIQEMGTCIIMKVRARCIMIQDDMKCYYCDNLLDGKHKAHIPL